MPHRFEARLLLRSAREATLATAGPDGPHAALVTPATTTALDVLMLLSGLSRHTRALLADPRCALLVTGPAQGANPQARPRLTVAGHATPIADPNEERDARARYLAIHPYAALYAGLGDFRLFRMRIDDALLVSGFGAARRITRDGLLPPDPGWNECEAAATLCGWLPGCTIAASDPDGVDLVQGEATRRLGFDAGPARHGPTAPASLVADLRARAAAMEEAALLLADAERRTRHP